MFLRDIWPGNEEIARTVRACVRKDFFQAQYASGVIPRQSLSVSAKRPDGTQAAFEVMARIDTPRPRHNTANTAASCCLCSDICWTRPFGAPGRNSGSTYTRYNKPPEYNAGSVFGSIPRQVLPSSNVVTPPFSATYRPVIIPFCRLFAIASR